MDPIIMFDKDFSNRRIIVTSKFKSPLAVIWDAFTNVKTMEKWWAPKPYKAVTKEYDFREGGRWLYYMLSPQGEKTWSLAEFRSIDPEKSYVALDAFSDENGVVDASIPRADWNTSFSEENGFTTVTNTISFEKEADMKQILLMGFEEGYRTGLGQLAELL